MSAINSTEKKRRLVMFSLLGILGVGCMGFLAFVFLSPEKNVASSRLEVAKTDTVKGQVGGHGTDEYNKRLEQHDAQKADSALNAGDSFIPSPVGKPSVVTKKQQDTPAPVAPPVTPARVQPVQTPRTDNAALKRMMEDLSALDTKLAAASMGQAAIVYQYEKPKEQAGTKPGQVTLESGDSASTSPALPMKPGDILYAVIDTGVNSDVPSAVMATVVSGKNNKTKLLGKFQRFDERLVLAFTRAILPTGEDVQLEAYAVDPGTTEASVASSVDTHFFSRWGGLVASAFLEGLGTAKRYSGAQSTMYGGGIYDGGATDQMVWSDYSISDQAWIAAGKVGEKSGKIFEKQFERPPTVTLSSGAPVGILVLNVKSR